MRPPGHRPGRGPFSVGGILAKTPTAVSPFTARMCPSCGYDELSGGLG